jgi:4-hydroxybenzoate polyprenyltransferase
MMGGGKAIVISLFSSLREFLSFMRVETCLFISGMAATGYLIFNPFSSSVIYSFLTVFFLSAAAYSYNHLTDRKEDAINNKKLNIFVINSHGRWLVIIFLLLSVSFSLSLPKYTFLAYMLWIIASLGYSAFSIKRTILLKNLYTALVIGISFLIGATAEGIFSKTMLIYYLLISSFGFNINLLGDLRGYKGDRLTGINTIPVRFGYGTGKRIFYGIFSLFLVSLLILNIKFLYPLMVFVLLAVFFLKADDLIKTRYSILSSFISLPVVLIFSKILGGL